MFLGCMVIAAGALGGGAPDTTDTALHGAGAGPEAPLHHETRPLDVEEGERLVYNIKSREPKKTSSHSNKPNSNWLTWSNGSKVKGQKR